VRALVLSTFYREPGKRDKLRALAGLGWEVVAATPGGEAATDGAVRLAPIPVKGNPAEPATLRWNAGALRRLLTELRPDLIQIEENPETPLAGTTATAATSLGVPYVIFSWESLPRPLGLLLRRRANRVLGGASGVIGGNRLAEELLRDDAPEAVSTALPQAGIAMPPLRSTPPREGLTIGFAGRLVPERGLDQLLEALSQTYGAWKLIVAGTGPEQEPLERLVERHGLAARVRWLGGIRPEVVEQLWPEIDCLAVPSRATPSWVEQHSTVLVDAMAHGLPALVTDTGALPELVGDAGVVAATVPALADALQQWVAEPARCRALGSLARQRALEHYTTAAIAARTAEFWQALLEERREVRHAS
jgi:glycosyltransferase involved in cell wall biosynthesis